MRPKRDPVPRARDAWVWLGGILVLGILGAGFAAAAVLLWENVDIRQLTPGLVDVREPLPQPEPPPPPAVESGSFAAVLFDSRRNADYFPGEGFYAGELDRWRDLLTEAGGRIREVGTADELRDVDVSEVLVLPEAPCLSTPERSAILEHVARGGSLVSNSALGARDGACDWLGWQTLARLTGAEAAVELPTREALYLTVPGGVALSPGLDPGTRIELRPDRSVALRLPGARVYWSDWAMNPAPDGQGSRAGVAAVADRTAAGGRIAWYGLRVGQAAGPADEVHLRRLVTNGVRWAAGIASASPSPWPGGSQAAMVLTLDVESEPRNALGVAQLLERERLPGSFFAVTQIVAEDEDLARALALAGELGSQTASHIPLAGLTAQDQTLRLRRSWAHIEDWTGSGPLGLRPPEDAFDATTLRAWRRAGGMYLVSRTNARSASPEIHRTDEGVIVVLPQLLKDDYNIVVQDRVRGAEGLGEAFVRGAEKVHAIGGLAVVAGHTQIMRNSARVDVFRTVAEAARADGDWWMARAGGVAEWWRARSQVRIAFDGEAPAEDGSAAPGLPDIVIRAGAARLDGLWLDVVLPGGSEGVTPWVGGRTVAFQATDWGVRIPVGALEPGAETRLSLLGRAPGSTTAMAPR